jgi:hypothetical protein
MVNQISMNPVIFNKVWMNKIKTKRNCKCRLDRIKFFFVKKMLGIN